MLVPCLSILPVYFFVAIDANVMNAGVKSLETKASSKHIETCIHRGKTQAKESVTKYISYF